MPYQTERAWYTLRDEYDHTTTLAWSESSPLRINFLLQPAVMMTVKTKKIGARVFYHTQ